MKSDKFVFYIVVSVASVIVFVGGITAIGMYNTVSGLAALFIIMGAMLFIALFATRRGLTPAKFIAAQNKAVRNAFSEIRGRVLEIDPNIIYTANYALVFAYYRKEYMERPSPVLMMQPRIFSTKIRITYGSDSVTYKDLETVVKAKDIDMDFITDAVVKNVNRIKEYFGIDRENNNA